MESFRFLGHPEGDLALAQAAVYLATAPKSNSVYKAWNAARKLAQEKGALPVPLHIRNAPTKLMKDMGYGRDYRYAHDYTDGYTVQEYLPDTIAGSLFHFPTNRGYEKTIAGRLKRWRKLKEKTNK
jgi:putative ATPase